MQPVATKRTAGQVQVEAARIISDGLACAHIVGLGGIHILDAVVEEPPLPDDVALHIHFHQRIHLRAVVWPVLRVGTGSNGLLLSDGAVGNEHRGRRIQLLVEDADGVMVRVIVGTLLYVLPDHFSVPVDFLDSRQLCLRITIGAEHMPIGQ